MDSDFMSNLNNLMKNGTIPNDMKEQLNGFLNQNANSTSQGSTKESSKTKGQEEQTTSSENNPTSSINPEMIQNVMKMFSQMNHNNDSSNGTTNDSNQSSNGSMPNIDIGTILKMKNIMDKMQNNKDDPRSNLLLSLKPYLKESRKSKVEQYVQLFNMTKIMDVFNENGGEKIK